MTSQQSSAAGADTRSRLLEAIPLTEHKRDLAGIATAVLEGGDGPPIVLLHGHGEFAAVWARVIPDLVSTHRVIVPDLPGHGASDVGATSLDSNTVMTWVSELIDQTCATQPVLAGHLLGGSIAARFAADHSDRLASLVLVDTLGLSWFRPATGFAVPMMRFVARPTPRTRDRLFDRCFLDIDKVGEDTGEQWQPMLDYALDRARTPSVQAAMRRLIPRLGMRPIPPEDLARITVPTVLIHGRHDLQVRVRTAEKAAARYGWPLHVIEECRDDPAVEQPQQFLAALRAAIMTNEEQK